MIPFTIACGNCFFCEKTLWSLCDNSNPADNQDIAEGLMGHSPSGLFGYSHMTGGYAGGQAEYVRVPYADVGPMVVPDHLEDEQVLFLTDIFPTGYMAAEQCDIERGDTVAVWGAGPVGQFAIRSAFMLGAERVIAIDHREARLQLAAEAGAECLNFETVHILDALSEMTGGRGPDRCIDAVGMEAHGLALDNLLDRAKQAIGIGTDRPHVLREAIIACRKGGTVSIPGVYGGLLDNVPVRRGDEQGAGVPHRPDPRPPLPEAAAGTYRGGPDRPPRHRQPPPAAEGRADGVQELQGQAGRVQEGRAEAVTATLARAGLLTRAA